MQHLTRVGAIAYPRIFEDLDEEHVRAAHRHLSKPPRPMTSPNARPARLFNLDAAKLLYVNYSKK